MRPMKTLKVGDRVRGDRSDFGRTGVVTKVRRGRVLPLVTVKFDDNGKQREAALSRWEKI